MRQVWHNRLLLLRVVLAGAGGLVLDTRQLGARRCEGTLCARLPTLLRLDRAEVVAAPGAMVDEVALAEGLLEVLARFTLESTRVLLWGLHAGARAFIHTRLACLI